MVVEADLSTVEATTMQMDAIKHEDVEPASSLDGSHDTLIDEEDEAKDVEEETANAELAVLKGEIRKNALRMNLASWVLHCTSKGNLRDKLLQWSNVIICGDYYINTEPGCLIELMKFDMEGVAAVSGAANALEKIKPAELDVHFTVASCENMINDTVMSPGGIIQLQMERQATSKSHHSNQDQTSQKQDVNDARRYKNANVVKGALKP
ncbi:hypothetical protein HAX54_043326 [Datura stramonium]|uniref:Cytosol aminopeptidase domain-containing protein n=1 Tax=Datura stramonium TaxID=4076 RepID=A0ABS8W0S4_DATST|nr:hypothetical protein [Datura stramonium]